MQKVGCQGLIWAAAGAGWRLSKGGDLVYLLSGGGTVMWLCHPARGAPPPQRQRTMYSGGLPRAICYSCCSPGLAQSMWGTTLQLHTCASLRQKQGVSEPGLGGLRPVGQQGVGEGSGLQGSHISPSQYLKGGDSCPPPPQSHHRDFLLVSQLFWREDVWTGMWKRTGGFWRPCGAGLVSPCLTDHNLDSKSLHFLQNHHVPGSVLEIQKNYFSQQPWEEVPL